MIKVPSKEVKQKKESKSKSKSKIEKEKEKPNEKEIILKNKEVPSSSIE